MPNNLKLPPQTQPSTLEIVFRDGQMNLATAIGRLEQAVTKAYGNINSSINSKQGEFNQALLKTLDQSISKSSDKMDQFYTSSFAKIYALNSAIMEQSLQRGGMAAAQKDFDGYKNYDKLFENQQRAFGDIKASLQLLLERSETLTNEQVRGKINNYTKANNVPYQDVSTFWEITNRHDVSMEDTLKNFSHMNDSFKNRKDQDSLKKDPIIAALISHNEDLLKELQGTSNITEFIVLLIQNLSKAKKEKNEAIMKQARENLSPGMFAAMTDEDISFVPPDKIKGKTKEEIQEIYNNNLLNRILVRADRENNLNTIIESNKSSYISKEKKRIEDIDGMSSKVVTSKENDEKNKQFIHDNSNDPTPHIQEKIKSILSDRFNPDRVKKGFVSRSVKSIISTAFSIVPSVSIGPLSIDLKSKYEENNKRDEQVEKDYLIRKDISKMDTQDRKIFPVSSPKQKVSRKQGRFGRGYISYPAPSSFFFSQPENNETDLDNRPWVKNMMTRSGSSNQSKENVGSLLSALYLKAIPQSNKSVVFKKENNQNLLQPNLNSQLAQQILHKPSMMQQRLNIRIALTQNGSIKSEYSLEKNTSFPTKGNGSVVMVDNFSTQMALAKNKN